MLDIITGASYSRLILSAGSCLSPSPSAYKRALDFLRAVNDFHINNIDHAGRRQVGYGKAKSK